jgi:hypothetical protein
MNLKLETLYTCVTCFISINLNYSRFFYYKYSYSSLRNICIFRQKKITYTEMPEVFRIRIKLCYVPHSGPVILHLLLLSHGQVCVLFILG